MFFYIHLHTHVLYTRALLACIYRTLVFPDGSVVRDPSSNAGDMGSIPVFGKRDPGVKMTAPSSILAQEMPWTEGAW